MSIISLAANLPLPHSVCLVAEGWSTWWTREWERAAAKKTSFKKLISFTFFTHWLATAPWLPARGWLQRRQGTCEDRSETRPRKDKQLLQQHHRERGAESLEVTAVWGLSREEKRESDSPAPHCRRRAIQAAAAAAKSAELWEASSPESVFCASYLQVSLDYVCSLWCRVQLCAANQSMISAVWCTRASWGKDLRLQEVRGGLRLWLLQAAKVHFSSVLKSYNMHIHLWRRHLWPGACQVGQVMEEGLQCGKHKEKLLVQPTLPWVKKAEDTSSLRVPPYLQARLMLCSPGRGTRWPVSCWQVFEGFLKTECHRHRWWGSSRRR